RSALPECVRKIGTVLISPPHLSNLLTTASRSTLGEVRLFLEWTGQHLPEVHQALAVGLVESGCRRLVYTSLHRNVSGLAPFITYCQTKIPSLAAVFKAEL